MWKLIFSLLDSLYSLWWNSNDSNYLMFLLCEFLLPVWVTVTYYFIFELKIYTALGYIVSLILLNLGHVFRFRIVSRTHMADDDLWNNVTKSCVYLQLKDVSPRGFSRDHYNDTVFSFWCCTSQIENLWICFIKKRYVCLKLFSLKQKFYK